MRVRAAWFLFGTALGVTAVAFAISGALWAMDNDLPGPDDILIIPKPAKGYR